MTTDAKPLAELIAELRELGMKASPSPWAYDDDMLDEDGQPCKEPNIVIGFGNWRRYESFIDEHDARLMVAMRNALPALLDAAEAKAKPAGEATERERQLLMADCRGYETQIAAMQAELAAAKAHLMQAESDRDGLHETLIKTEAKLAEMEKERDGAIDARNLQETQARYYERKMDEAQKDAAGLRALANECRVHWEIMPMDGAATTSWEGWMLKRMIAALKAAGVEVES